MTARLIILFLLLSLIPAADARKPKLKMEPVAQTYDFANVQDRYRWYQDMRSYISKNGGLACPLGTPLHINKNGIFSVDKGIQIVNGQVTLTLEDASCLNSVTRLRFPLPDNFPGDSVIFPIRDGRKPMTSQELDTLIFKLPSSNPVAPAR